MFRFLARRFDVARLAPGGVFALLLAACCWGCGIPGSIDRTNVELRNAIDTLDRSIDVYARRPPSRTLEKLPRATGEPGAAAETVPDVYARKGAADDPDPLAACEGWTGYAIARADLRRHIAALRQS